MRRVGLAVISAILLLAITVAAVSARQAAATKNGSLEGIVIESRSGEPIAEAQIRLTGGAIDPAAYERLKTAMAALLKIVVPPPDDLSAEQLIESIRDLAVASGVSMHTTQLHAPIHAFRNANDSRFRAQSDREGRFTIANIPPGRYTAEIQHKDYFGAGSGDVVVNVAAGQTAHVNLTMTLGGIIAGRVTRNGEPRTGLSVQALAIQYRNGYPIMQPVVSRNTDDRGQYRLFNLPPGDYLVAVTPRNMARPTVVDTTQVSVPSAPALTGRVEQPLQTFYPGTIDRAAAAIVSIRNGREAVSIDIPLMNSALYRVSGEVRLTVPPSTMTAASQQGNTVRASVTFAHNDSNAPDDGTGSWIEQELGGAGITLQPAGNILVGRFQADNIPPGFYDWRATVYETGADGGNRPTTTSVPIEVRGADVEGLRFDVHSSVTVKGNVTVDGKPPGSNKVRVGLQVEGAAGRRPGYQALAARTVAADDKTGAFSIAGVSMGRFRVILDGPLPPKLYLEDVRSGGQSVFDPGFDVDATEPPPIEVLLRSGAGSTAGTVIDGDNKPVARAAVALVPTLAYRQNRARFHAATADAGGKFSIANVAPGEYKLFAWPAAVEKQESVWVETGPSQSMRLAWPEVSRGAYFNAAFLSRFEEKGLPVTISGQGATVTAELTVIATAEQ